MYLYSFSRFCHKFTVLGTSYPKGYCRALRGQFAVIRLNKCLIPEWPKSEKIKVVDLCFARAHKGAASLCHVF